MTCWVVLLFIFRLLVQNLFERSKEQIARVQAGAGGNTSVIHSELTATALAFVLDVYDKTSVMTRKGLRFEISLLKKQPKAVDNAL